MILNRAKAYYENDKKKKLKKQVGGKYRNLFEEEKNKKRDLEKIDIIISRKKRNKD